MDPGGQLAAGIAHERRSLQGDRKGDEAGADGERTGLGLRGAGEGSQGDGPDHQRGRPLRQAVLVAVGADPEGRREHDVRYGGEEQEGSQVNHANQIMHGSRERQ